MKKFDWNASESAPRDYPMQIVSGVLSSKDGTSQLIPNGSSIYHGWGRGWSTDIVGDDLKSLPCELSITFFSYTEDQFYSDRFKLPYEKILMLFQHGYFSPKEEKNITFNKIIVGVSPGGFVSVWLGGIDKRIEVFSAVSKKMKSDWSLINNNHEITKEYYMKVVLDGSIKSEEVKQQIKNHDIPVNRWNKYSSSVYQWTPKFTGIKLRNNWIQNVKYFNGNKGYLNYPLSNDELNNKRAVPKEMDFAWSYDKTNKHYYELFFDEDEMYSSFERLGKNDKPIELEMKLYFEGEQGKFDVLLKNGNETIHLKKFRLETYGAN